MPIKTIDSWRDHVAEHFKALRQESQEHNFKSFYEELLACILSPVVPRSKTGYNNLLKIIKAEKHSDPIVARLKSIYARGDYTLSAADLVRKLMMPRHQSDEMLEGLDWLLARVGILQAIASHADDSAALIRQLNETMAERGAISSAISVQLGTMRAGENAIIAAGDARVFVNNYNGSKAALKSYLAGIRSEWNTTEFGSILPAFSRQIGGNIRLHQLYAPVDIWRDIGLEKYDVEALTERRFKAIEKDLSEARQSAIEAIAIEPLIVITGGPGTGKSALCRYLATALAYACDPAAEKSDGVDGIALLGPAWIHGAILPLYVNLRNFCADKSVFPTKPEDGKAQCLLQYLQKITGTFGKEIEAYLTNTDVHTHGAFLFLDGLDEVYSEKDRIILQSIIENWANRFTKCRILVTSRTYAYRRDAKWRLSDRFVSAELAPYTFPQMKRYIENWYSQAAVLRPAMFGGRDTALAQTKILAADLTRTIRDTDELQPLAKLPLMLAMLTLVHENNKKLPIIKADLYEKTVDLLDRWKSITDDTLAKQLAGIDLRRVRAALMLLAFDVQKSQKTSQKYPATIRRADLIDKLIDQDKNDNGIGAPIDAVVEYLGTRNGILVSDANNLYRFPHMSIQEYLAACALVELFDECQMPPTLKPKYDDEWVFPENVVALLLADHDRWRNVTLFAGSIVASDRVQEFRWSLIKALLAEQTTGKYSESIMNAVYIAGEIWAENYLKARRPEHRVIKRKLFESLKRIRYDERLDAPERQKTQQILIALAKNETNETSPAKPVSPPNPKQT